MTAPTNPMKIEQVKKLVNSGIPLIHACNTIGINKMTSTGNTVIQLL